MNKDKLFEVAEYFWLQNIQVVPITPNKKYPDFKGWEQFRFRDRDQIKRAINKGFGLGLKPNRDFIYVDLDSDHGNYDGRANFEHISDINTITASKPNSNNLHLFYRNPTHEGFRFTGNDAIIDGVEISSRDSQIRIEPAYSFDNLDFNKPFLEQLGVLNEDLSTIIKSCMPKPRAYEPKKNRQHHIKNYLKKVEPFDVGSRAQSYRTLVFTMVVKNNMSYDEVFDAVVEWDKGTINFQEQEPDQFFHAIREPNK